MQSVKRVWVTGEDGQLKNSGLEVIAEGEDGAVLHVPHPGGGLIGGLTPQVGEVVYLTCIPGVA